MLKSARLSASLLRSTRPLLSTTPKTYFSTTPRAMDAYKKAGNRKDEPPQHEMVHFAGLLSSKREFGDFRTVLHTGLYSQVVAMEVPVGGDIGDEVCFDS
jgi:putative ABC transport system ATP-binding protein